jgi:serine/threonine-protein kinase
VEAPPFAILLREFRVRAELTQEELAERARLSARVISDLERGVSLTPRVHTVRQLADALELSPPERARFTDAGRRRSAAEVDPGERLDQPVAPADPQATDVRTFLLADIRGYTRFTIDHGDEAAARLAARFAEVTEQIVVPLGGQVVELRGGEALVVFTSSRQGLRAAVELQTGYTCETSEALPLHVGIGLDAGEGVLVNDGYRGAAVNLAARLCNLAGGGEILASEGIVHLARKVDGLAYLERGFVELRGFAAPIRVVEVAVDFEATESAPPGAQTVVTGHRAAREQPMPIGGFLGALPAGPMVARTDELDRVMAIADLAASGLGQFVLLTGERGIGKTRLAQELTLTLRDRGFLIATGRCYEAQQSTPFLAMAEAMTAAYRGASAAVQLAAMRQLPHLSRIIPDELPPRAAQPSDTSGEHLRLLHAATRLLNTIAGERPVGIFLDDLQWADSDSLDLFVHLVRNTRSHRIFLCATCADHDLPADHAVTRLLRDLAREHLMHRVAIRRLPPEGTAELIAATLGETEASEDFLGFVQRRTRGNPYFIHRLLRTLGGHYRLIRQIGAGGMGRIFEAVDTETGQRVAAKLMFARSEADAHALQRFEQEGVVLATLHHPNIVEVYGTFLDEHASCIVMELLAGRSLAEILRSEELDPDRVKNLMAQVCAALSCAHEQGIAHRDVKPANIMVLPDDRVKVTDFGIARMLRPVNPAMSMTSTGMTLGTPLYMAPEQIGSQKVDGRADIYSLGAVMYELVAGHPPFTGDDPLSVAMQHVQVAPVPPSRFNPGLPAAWDVLILKALAKRPADRHPSTAAFGAVIAALPTDWVSEPCLEETGTGRPASSESADAKGRASSVGAEATLSRRLAAATRRSGRRQWLLAGGISTILVTAGALLATNTFTFAGFRQQTPVRFAQLKGLAIDGHGDIYAVDHLKARVLELSAQGSLLTEVQLFERGRPVAGDYSTVGPDGIVLDAAGNVYVASYTYHGIQRITPAGKTVGPWPYDIGRPQQVPFSPTGMAVDPTGSLYVADTLDGQILKISRSGRVSVFWGNAVSPSGQLQGPTGIAVGKDGVVYASDTENSRILRISPSGKSLGYWGAQGTGPGQLESPGGLVVDPAGNVYVADTDNHRIQKFSPTGRSLAVWGLPQLRLNSPIDVKLDAQGNVYVADSASDLIVKLSPAGKVLETWGGQASS